MSRKPPNALIRLAFYVEHHVESWGWRLRRKLGLARPPRILPYRGYGRPGAPVVKARVLEDRHVRPPGSATRCWAAPSPRGSATRRGGSRRRVKASLGRAPLGGASPTRRASWTCGWSRPPGARPGWHDVELELPSPAPEGSGARAGARAGGRGRGSEYGVISDIDDTVIVTNVTNFLKRAWTLFLTEHRTRLPFEGVDAFYEALHEGSTGSACNPIFYVSSSPWNLYEHLDEFLGLHRIPAGPLLLRDWGLSRRRASRPAAGTGTSWTRSAR